MCVKTQFLHTDISTFPWKIEFILHLYFYQNSQNLNLSSCAGTTAIAGGAFHGLECPENGNSNTVAAFQNISEKREYSVASIFRPAQRGQSRLFLELPDKFRFGHTSSRI